MCVYPSMQEQIARCICRLMGEQKLSPAELTRRAGVSRSTLRAVLEPGDREVMLGTLHRILAALGMTLARFFSQPEFKN